MLRISVELILDLAGSVCSKVILIPKTCGPRRKCRYGTSSQQNGGLYVDHVSVLKAHNLAYFQVLIRVFKADLDRCVETLGGRNTLWFTVRGRNIQNRVELISKALIVGPQ